MKLFQFLEHIGKFKVLVQDRDIADGAVTEEKLADGAISARKIAGRYVSRNHLTYYDMIVPMLPTVRSSQDLTEEAFIGMTGGLDKLREAIQFGYFFRVVWDGVTYDAELLQQETAYAVIVDMKGSYLGITFEVDLEDQRLISASIAMDSDNLEREHIVNDITKVSFDNPGEEEDMESLALVQVARCDWDTANDGVGQLPEMYGQKAFLLGCYDDEVGDYHLRYSGEDTQFFYTIGTPDGSGTYNYPLTAIPATLDELETAIIQQDDQRKILVWLDNKPAGENAISVYRRIY